MIIVSLLGQPVLSESTLKRSPRAPAAHYTATQSKPRATRIKQKKKDARQAPDHSGEGREIPKKGLVGGVALY